MTLTILEIHSVSHKAAFLAGRRRPPCCLRSVLTVYRSIRLPYMYALMSTNQSRQYLTCTRKLTRVNIVYRTKKFFKSQNYTIVWKVEVSMSAHNIRLRTGCVNVGYLQWRPQYRFRERVPRPTPPMNSRSTSHTYCTH